MSVTHQVFWAVLQRYPGMTVIAHHDLVRGHPITPVNIMREKSGGWEEEKKYPVRLNSMQMELWGDCEEVAQHTSRQASIPTGLKSV